MRNLRKKFHPQKLRPDEYFTLPWILLLLLLFRISYYYYCVYTGWLVTGGTRGKGMILREKRSRKYRIKIFRSRLCFRENRLWIFARQRSTVRSVTTRRDKVRAYRAKIQSRFSRKQSLKRKLFIPYFRLLFSRRITPFPLVPPVTNHPVYCIIVNIVHCIVNVAIYRYYVAIFRMFYCIFELLHAIRWFFYL